MHGVGRDKKTHHIIAASALFVGVVALVGVALYLTLSIDYKLNRSAEQQVVIFTEQAAAGVSDQLLMIESVIEAFTVQSSDPKQIAASLEKLKHRVGFSEVAFAGMDGAGSDAEGNPFTVDQLEQAETALAQEQASYSSTFLNDEGARVRLAQRPLYIDEQQVGALYVEVPLSLFATSDSLTMFDGRGCLVVFESSSGEILASSSEAMKTPIANGTTLYGYLDDAAYSPKTQLSEASEVASSDSRASRVQQEFAFGSLQDVVASGSSGLMTATVEEKVSYVSVAPIGEGELSVCSVVSVEDVRAEAKMVTTTLQIVFALVLACLIVVGVLLFITYRRYVRERNVAMLSQLTRALSDSVDFAVDMYAPADNAVTSLVAKAKDIIGYPLDEFLNDPHIADTLELSSEGIKLFTRLRAGLIRGLEKGEFSFRGSSTESLRWVSFSVSPLTFSGKDQVFIVLRDSTSEKKIQLSMKDAMDAAESANQAKSEFLSRMSHEIRTPMNVILGMLQIAHTNKDDCAKLQISLERIQTASGNLLGLINDVLDLSKIESGKMTLLSEPFRLDDLLGQVTSVIRMQCEQRGQQFDAAIPSGVDGVYVGDAARIKQLLINLLANSVKYTPEGGRVCLETTVASTAVMGYRQIIFAIADNGIGMSEDFVGHIFEPFAMEGRSHEQGTGLGMPIVKNIVTMMGGSISVDSALGKGTTFRVVINVRIAFEAERKLFEDAARVEGEEALSDGKTASEQEFNVRGHSLPDSSAFSLDSFDAPRAFGRNELEGLRVLIVEDNDLNAEIAGELLSEAGLITERADDGEVACAMFEASSVNYYDVILMDVQMPRMNGYEATRAIRAFDRADASRVPIVAMSANAFSDDVAASLTSGMNAHLSKPIEVRKVLTTMVKFVRERNNGSEEA